MGLGISCVKKAPTTVDMVDKTEDDKRVCQCGAIKPNTVSKDIAPFIEAYMKGDTKPFICPRCQIQQLREEAIANGVDPKKANDITVLVPMGTCKPTHLEQVGFSSHHTNNLR